jgi:hypothetical protein
MQSLLGLVFFFAMGVVWVAGNIHIRNRCLRRLGRPKPANRDWDFSHNFPFREYDRAERRWLAAIIITAILLGLLSSVFLNGAFS